MSTPPGSLEGKYEVIAKIREGGMGAIYKVRHRLLNELRVIKVMRPDVAQSPEQRKRFLREAQTATRLRHPNIVAFYDFFVDEEDTAYMVMEYIEGINFRDALRACGAFPVPLAIEVSSQCLAAFDYLHRRKIVHRDVSPDNIMLTREEDGTLRAKLIDLGIAKIAQATEELTAADEFIGKLRYSSPEQLTKSAASPQIDGRSDLFSFGIVVYEILTGICPYGGESIHEIIGNRLQNPPLPFDVSDPKGLLPPALKEAVLKALRTAPEERYATASDFDKALAPFAAAGTDGAAAERYVERAMSHAATGASSGAGDLGPTVKAGLAAADAGGITAARDRKFRSTIARWADATPASESRRAEEVYTGSPPETDRFAAEATVTAGVALPGSVERAGRERGTPLARYAAVAFAAALLVGFGVWISRRERPAETGAVERPTPASSLAGVPAGPAAAPETRADEGKAPLPARIEAEPSPLPAAAAEPTARGAAAEVTPPSRAAQAKPTTRPRPTPPTRLAQVLPTKAASSADRSSEISAGERAGAVVPPGPKMRYCAQLDDTVYKQGVTKDVPAGFEGMAAKAPRPDSGLMRVAVSLSKEHPMDDEPFVVAVRFENGGDARVEVAKLEESASRGGLRAVGGAAVPVSVSPGGVKEIYRYPLTLSGGEPYVKQFVVSDPKGDSWRTGIRIVPCGD
ncbi:MAG TPA: serine/threonine-protein kinase [Thermoanaerobaculia bacterium]|nr:serine/threonine-protein kinase [Thermoanaerobaculia bacterium]